MILQSKTTYSYDPAGQVTNIMHQLTATATPINKADYLYNGVGNRTSLTDRRGVPSACPLSVSVPNRGLIPFPNSPQRLDFT